MEHRTSEIVGFGSSQVNLREDRFAPTADLLALPTEHFLDHNIIDASKNEECASCGRPMLSLCHKTREQFAKEQHVVHNVEQVVELGFFVAWVKFDEQFSMFVLGSDALGARHGSSHSKSPAAGCQQSHEGARSTACGNAVMQWVRYIITNNLAMRRWE